MIENDKYTVVLLDADGFDLACAQVMTLTAGAAQASTWLNDPEYVAAGAFKVEVRDNRTARASAECVRDYFLSQLRAPRAPKARTARSGR